MSRQQRDPRITVVDDLKSRKDGRAEIRYQVRCEIGTGSRQRAKRRFRTEKEAKNFLARIDDQRASGTLVAKTGTTVREVCEAWLAGKTGVRRVTWTNYRDYLKPVILLYGDMPVQDLKKSHIEKLLELLESGDLPRPRGQKRTPYKPQSLHHVLSKLNAVLDSEVKQGHLERNAAMLVETPPLTKKKRPTFDVEQLQKLLRTTQDDREGIAWQFGSLGLRRAEIAGMRWQDVDFDKHTIKICHTRVMVDGRAEESTPKTQASNRTLPIPDPVYSALLHARAMQTRDGMISEYVVINEHGKPYRPEQLTKVWRRTCKRLELPAITLHDERHTCATLYIYAGVPPIVVKAWLGHESIRFTLDTYVSDDPTALLEAATVHAQLSRDGSTPRVKKAG